MHRLSARSLRPSKAWVALGVALLLGLLAAWLAGRYLTHRLAEIESRSPGQTTQVVVAAQDLPAGTQLTSALVLNRDVPVDFAQSQAIRENQFLSQVQGRVLAFDLRRGEQLLWSMLEGPRVATFSARVAPGRRAITVAVDEINSISGLLEPGDSIDLLLTFTRNAEKVTAPLLEGVKVLATGRRSVDDPRSGEARTYSTVTLDTSWQEAQNIVVGREQGKLTALLRNPEDGQPVPGVITNLAAMLAQRAPEIEGTRAVPVMYGGRGGASIPPEALHLGQYAAATPARLPGQGADAALFLESLRQLGDPADVAESAGAAGDAALPPVDSRRAASAPAPVVPVLSGGAATAR